MVVQICSKTHIKIKKQYPQEFTDHINNIDPDIKFTTEREENRSLAFLDTLTVIKPDGNLEVKIYRKPTHTDQYLNFKFLTRSEESSGYTFPR